MIPPPLPSNYIYTSCWCEENIYLLCQNFIQNQSLRDLWEVFAIFISNSNKTVALWYQKAAQFEEDPVLWDYHVVLLLRPRQGVEESMGFNDHDMSWVYDFDTTLPVPCPGQAYFDMTFPSKDLVFQYESRFRVVPAAQFLQHFASDRSHMLKKSGSTSDMTQQSGAYLSPPPLYKPLCGPSAAERGVENNLMSHFVSMTPIDNIDDYGKVLDRTGIESFL
ncbi:hypothetical protein BYT27DRAFT_7195342 [Phlegmacium glaucopus]|nr:hypothetical protein BYT27DRAFT_7195342 [Phlegmacium glaucopus]